MDDIFKRLRLFQTVHDQAVYPASWTFPDRRVTIQHTIKFVGIDLLCGSIFIVLHSGWLNASTDAAQATAVAILTVVFRSKIVSILYAVPPLMPCTAQRGYIHPFAARA